MQRTLFPWIAGASTLLAGAALLSAARRPVYGGELRVEVRAAMQALLPQFPDDPATLGTQARLSPLVFETYVRLDEHGRPQPWLATSWTHEGKFWIFQLRKGLKLHDGSTYSPAGGSFGIGDDYPIDVILADLANPRNALTFKKPDGTMLGTGPYKIARWEAGKSATLVANDQYWGGRPYLDSISLQMGRSLADQASDFQLGKADVVEISVRDLRAVKQRGGVVWNGPPEETVALQVEGAPGLRQALALSVDRSAILNVLLQKQGEISAALLPGWVSGYSFLFPTERNIASARTNVPLALSATFSYDRQDPVIRSIAERIAVNASEVRIMLRPVVGSADVRLVRLPLVTRDPFQDLRELSLLFKMAPPAVTSGPYEIEKSILESTGLIPLFHLPLFWMLSPRVRNWPDLDDVWLDPRSAP